MRVPRQVVASEGASPALTTAGSCHSADPAWLGLEDAEARPPDHSPIFACPSASQEILGQFTLDSLLEMNEARVKDTLRRCGAGAEECSRLQSALTCLRKVTGLGR